jgi:hypothetical protein
VGTYANQQLFAPIAACSSTSQSVSQSMQTKL